MGHSEYDLVSIRCCKNSYCYCFGDGDGYFEECAGEGAYFCGDEWLDPTNPPSTICHGGGECSPDACCQGSTSTTPPTTPEPKDCWEVCKGIEDQVIIEDFCCKAESVFLFLVCPEQFSLPFPKTSYNNINILLSP